VLVLLPASETKRVGGRRRPLELSGLPGLHPLHRLWATAVGAALAAESPRFVLDLRSEAYVALGPMPAAVSSAYVSVVTTGTVRPSTTSTRRPRALWSGLWPSNDPVSALRRGLLRWAGPPVSRSHPARTDLLLHG
jgi:hypothetical protein